jgi:hypothetical protein
MSKTDIFRNRDPMPSEQDPQTVNVIQTRADAVMEGKANLPGAMKFPNDVMNTHAGRPQPTGRRP